MKNLFFLIFLSSCASNAMMRTPASSNGFNTWRDLVRSELDQRGIQNIYPDTQYLKGWRIDSDVVMDKKPPMPNELNEVSVSCKDKRLFPAHPQQTTKEYLYGISSYYDHGRLPPKSGACMRPNPTNRFCVMSTWAKLAVISDTYVDNCGNYYRGYWMVNYLKSDESMGTLLSKGRTVYEKPNSQFRGEYITGNTYPLKEKDFLFLSELWKGDAGKINRSRAESLKQGYRLQGRLFINE